MIATRLHRRLWTRWGRELRVQVSVSIPGVDAQVADAAAEWLEDSGAIEAVREAVAVSRRDGGAVLYVSTGGDPSLPFDGAVDRVEFEVISRYDLRVVERYADQSGRTMARPRCLRRTLCVRSG